VHTYKNGKATFAAISKATMTVPVTNFLTRVNAAAEKQQLIKLTVSSKRNKAAELCNVFVRPVMLKNKTSLSFVFRHHTKDITKNHSIEEGMGIIEQLMQDDFLNASLFTTEGDYHLYISKDGHARLVSKPASLQQRETLDHDREKVRNISAGAVYMKELGVSTSDGKVKTEMQDKFRQVNHYIEAISGIVKGLSPKERFHVADMGSGKGYLTFALYDYLHNHLSLDVEVTGIELRKGLVDQCNEVAAKAGFSSLRFIEGSIQDTTLAKTDMLVALHACDTATDDAIHKGIMANAEIIICAPCCHKQIRKEMQAKELLQPVTKHGILLERQAEIVTDTIRSLILEKSGYKTKVFEFISTEHTPKNVMIAAVKSSSTREPKEKIAEKINALKQLFGIRQHYLETLPGI
jgi:SAM-dependent methyltransferase